jgi:peroxiredoxin
MKGKYVKTLFLALILVLGYSDVRAKIPMPGDVAPRFCGLDYTGRMICSSKFFGPTQKKNEERACKAVLLIFSSRACPPCERMLPEFTKFYKEWHSSGVQMILVRFKETPAEMKEYRNKYGVPFLMISDLYGKIAQSYGVTGYPRTFILTASGKIYKIILGEDKELEKTLEGVMGKMGIKRRVEKGGTTK